MKRENILFVAVLVSSLVPQFGVIWSLLFLYKSEKGKRLFLESGIVWIAWVISTVLTFVLLTATEETTSYPTVKSMLILHSLRIAVLTFVNTGVIAGVLFLLKRHRKTAEILPNIWRKSFVLSIATCLTLYALILLSFYILESFFGKF